MNELKKFIIELGVSQYFAGAVADLLVKKYREVGEEGFKLLFDQLVVLVKEAAE